MSTEGVSEMRFHAVARNLSLWLVSILVFLVFLEIAVSFAGSRHSPRDDSMPYAAAGLTERQAAARLLDRFTFGPTPQQVDEIVDVGLEEWFSRQLEAKRASEVLEAKLSRLSTLDMTNEDIAGVYPPPGRVRAEMIEEGKLDSNSSEEETRRAIREYYRAKGYRSQRALIGELITQKVWRAAESPNQIEEVMVDFWFNHFYVSASDNQCRRYVGTYERDSIRRYALKSFDAMLEATTKHPAMLLYLDNARSSAADGAVTTASLARTLKQTGRGRGDRNNDGLERMENGRKRGEREMQDDGVERPRRGINENYARELLELHTLGVDGGYTQDDVVETARALTGWTVLPEGERREKVLERMKRNKKFASELGFAVQGDFFFNAEWHDAERKIILGVVFEEGGGLEEGEAVLDMLAAHPSTARHIARKLAVRFVSDVPPERLVEDLARVFERTRGDIRALLWQIVRSREFWSPETTGAKIKTPFELVVSSVRGLEGDVVNPRGLIQWMDRMGQPLYRYQAPTGFPDRAEMWISAGSLLYRINFGLSLAGNQVSGVRVSLRAMEDAREPESLDAALEMFAARLLPERNIEETVRTLRPLLGRPNIAEAIRKRSSEEAPAVVPEDSSMDDVEDDFAFDPQETEKDEPESETHGTPPMNLAQVIGLILGSPEFQRR
jgi:uncharacterized protein (DUF1800 family)